MTLTAAMKKINKQANDMHLKAKRSYPEKVYMPELEYSKVENIKRTRERDSCRRF